MTTYSHPDVLQQTDFRLLLAERLMSALAGIGFATLIGYQLYTMTNDPLSLGWLGLIEAVPALSLSLIGGYIANRANRKRIVLTTEAINIFCMLALMVIALNPERYGLAAIYSVVAVIGFAGGFDGVSMIVREVIMRVLSPEAMRGRIASVSWIFIGASNELGAFESGVFAKLLGTAPSVIAGGSVTLLVVAAVAATLPELRRLRLPDVRAE